MEVAPTYFHSAEARGRIHKHIYGCKIICIMRCPVERAYSLYRLLKLYGETDLSFEEALNNIPLLKESSLYATHLIGWQKDFGQEKLLVLFYDELKTDPRQYLQRVGNFINLPEINFNEDTIKKPKRDLLSKNRWLAHLTLQVSFFLRERRMYWLIDFAKRLGARKLILEGGGDLPPLDPEMEYKVRVFFQPEIEKLEKLLGCDLSRWKAPVSHK